MYLVQDPEKIKSERKAHEDKWEKLAREAKKKNPNFELPIAPYKDTHIVGHHNGLDNGNSIILQ